MPVDPAELVDLEDEARELARRLNVLALAAAGLEATADRHGQTNRVAELRRVRERLVAAHGYAASAGILLRAAAEPDEWRAAGLADPAGSDHLRTLSGELLEPYGSSELRVWSAIRVDDGDPLDGEPWDDAQC